MKKWLCVLTSLSVLAAAPVLASEGEASFQEDGQNPVMNFIGDYGYATGTINVSCTGKSDAAFKVTWRSSAAEYNDWEMSGTLDTDTLTVTYENCVKTYVLFNENGEIEKRETEYVDGTGSITFLDEPGLIGLTWKDDQEDIAGDAVFTYIYPIAPEREADIPFEEGDAGIQKLHGDVRGDIENGIYTIYIKALESDDENFWWEAYQGDKGDASFVELLTQTTMEDGYAYVGSFRAIDDGEDTIRLVHTNGHYCDGYLDFIVKTEGGEIKENIGGGEAFGTSGEELAPFFEGEWQEKDGGEKALSLSLGEDGTLKALLTDGEEKSYTMSLFYDCISEALVYWDGQMFEGAFESGKEAAAADGTGLFAFLPSDEENEGSDILIIWKDDTFGNVEGAEFIRK